MVVVSALFVCSGAARLLQRCASDTRLQAAQTTRACGMLAVVHPRCHARRAAHCQRLSQPRQRTTLRACPRPVTGGRVTRVLAALVRHGAQGTVPYARCSRRHHRGSCARLHRRRRDGRAFPRVPAHPHPAADARLRRGRCVSRGAGTRHRVSCAASTRAACPERSSRTPLHLTRAPLRTRLQVELIEYAPRKPHVLMTWPGRDTTLPSIMLNSHTDVVPAEASFWRRASTAAALAWCWLTLCPQS